jgi:hypothetical protein
MTLNQTAASLHSPSLRMVFNEVHTPILCSHSTLEINKIIGENGYKQIRYFVML